MTTPPPKLIFVEKLQEIEEVRPFDCFIVILTSLDNLPHFPGKNTIDSALKFDKNVAEDVTFHITEEIHCKRLIVAPTGPITRDYDDVRRFATAAKNGVLRAKKAGATKPLFVFPQLPTVPEFQKAVEVALLGALAALYEPLQGREALGAEKLEPITTIGFTYVQLPPNRTVADGHKLASIVWAIECGRRLARDVGGADPERMTPRKFAAHIVEVFKAYPHVKVDVCSDPQVLESEYPLLSAVARASQHVERHRPCVIHLEYEGEGPIERTLLLAGKGVTYDTGGVDIKYGGTMSGMSRDKLGAAGLAGFVLTAAILKPKGIRIVAKLGMVRNSVGSNGYVSDEVIVSHAGVRVKVGNSDAEGRMVLSDCVSHLRVLALQSVNPIVMTCATLTGHAGRAVGQYSITLDNGPAFREGFSKKLQEVSELWGEPFEVSILRKDDFEFVKPKNSDYDVLQCNTQPSSMTSRGHQFPAAFILIASGLANHGKSSARPIPFCHLDIAGSALEDGDWAFGKPTGVPIVSLTARYLLERV